MLFGNGNIGPKTDFGHRLINQNPHKPIYLYECLVASVSVCNVWKHYAMDFLLLLFFFFFLASHSAPVAHQRVLVAYVQ